MQTAFTSANAIWHFSPPPSPRRRPIVATSRPLAPRPSSIMICMPARARGASREPSSPSITISSCADGCYTTATPASLTPPESLESPLAPPRRYSTSNETVSVDDDVVVVPDKRRPERSLQPIERPPQKPKRTFRESCKWQQRSSALAAHTTKNSAPLNSLNLADATRCKNGDLAQKLGDSFARRSFWVQAEDAVLLFVNPFDNLTSKATATSSSHSDAFKTIAEEARGHARYHVTLSGESGSGKTSTAAGVAVALCCRVLDIPSAADATATLAATHAALAPLLSSTSEQSPRASIADLRYVIEHGAAGGRVRLELREHYQVDDERQTRLRSPSIFPLLLQQLSPSSRRRLGIERVSKEAFGHAPLDASLTEVFGACCCIGVSSRDLARVAAAAVLLATLAPAPSEAIKTANNDAAVSREFVNSDDNAHAVVGASILLGVSAQHLLRSLDGRRFGCGDRLRSRDIFIRVLLGHLAAHVVARANERLAGPAEVATGSAVQAPTQQLSPAASDVSTDDSGIGASPARSPAARPVACQVAVVEVAPAATPAATRRANVAALTDAVHGAMLSLFSRANCSSPFVVALFGENDSSLSPPPPPAGMVPKDAAQIPSPPSSARSSRALNIVCIRSNNDCEYLRFSEEMVRAQLAKYRQRATDILPAPPPKDYS